MLTKILLSIAALVAIAFLILVVVRIKNDNEVSIIWQKLADLPTENVFTEDMVAGLPTPVQRYFLHAIAPGTPLASSVTLEMSGSFRLGQDKQNIILNSFAPPLKRLSLSKKSKKINKSNGCLNNVNDLIIYYDILLALEK
ncbi:hypothetical protein NIES4106_43000 [Fischerella sp. NIES-4106]|jgi:hypothetical protein|nr:hypothetical protein NIES4106_43000 [Fischerella sp. NIES-4106]